MRRLAATLTVTFAGWAAVNGQTPDQPKTPVAGVPAPVAYAPGSPAVTLGAPVAAKQPVVRGQSADDGFSASRWTASLTEPNGDGVPAIAPLQIPTSTVTVSASSTYQPSAPAFNEVPVPPSDPMLPPSKSAAGSGTDRKTNYEHKSYFGEMFNGLGGGGPEGKCFESDHCFDYFASPVSNPFFAEDPRSLTEIRPIFIFQTIPTGNSLYRGGTTEFFGTQARVAITDQWSVVMNKLGGISINPDNKSLLPSETGFAEIWLGPKWTFLRNTETGTVAAAGATFQLPAGGPRVAQDTGKLSIAPYLSGAQNFGCTSYGSFNAMSTLGFSFATDSQRTDYFFDTFHIDFDVNNKHFLYPFIETNWFYYTGNGGARALNFEGTDLANFGSTNLSHRGNLSLATGVRYKFSECIQTGIALQFPLTNTQGFQSFRLGLDVIFRY